MIRQGMRSTGVVPRHRFGVSTEMASLEDVGSFHKMIVRRSSKSLSFWNGFIHSEDHGEPFEAIVTSCIWTQFGRGQGCLRHIPRCS
jgi:hypothetical protein